MLYIFLIMNINTLYLIKKTLCIIRYRVYILFGEKYLTSGARVCNMYQ